MSILTKEQAAHVAYMRDLYCGPSGYDEIDELISIIDELQARAPKQYTEQDAIEWYSEYYATTPTNKFHARDCAIDALRYFGALKAEP